MSDGGVWKTMEDIEQSMIRVSSFTPSEGRTLSSSSSETLTAEPLPLFTETAGDCGGGRGRLNDHLQNNSLIGYREQCVLDDLKSAPHMMHNFCASDLRNLLNVTGRFDDAGEEKEFVSPFGRTKKKTINLVQPPDLHKSDSIPEPQVPPVESVSDATASTESSNGTAIGQPSVISCGLFESKKPRRCRNALLLSLPKKETKQRAVGPFIDHFPNSTLLTTTVDPPNVL